MERTQETTSTKITDFFPSSPGKDIALEALANILPTPETSPVKDKTTSTSEKDCDNTPVKSSQPTDNQSSTGTTCGKKITEDELLNEDKSKSLMEDVPQKEKVSALSRTECKERDSSLKSEAPKPKATSGKPRNQRGRSKKSTVSSSSSQVDSTSTSDSKPKTSQKKKKDIVSTNHVLTDYFPVRRSGRRCISNIKKDETNRIENAVLNGLEIGLEVVDIEGKGRGVVATQDFRRGGFVVEYAGDLINLTDAKIREEKYAAEPDKFGCYMYYFTHKNKNYCVDATLESGRLGRLLNHSKKGNCHTRLTEVQGLPRLILVASRDIQSGEELLYDYGDRSKSSVDAHPWLKS